MKKTALTTLLLFFFCNAYCQNFTGCIEINFEEIPGETPQEGLSISNQYFASHGVSFVLENGNPPVLAEVGGAATAFSSTFGSDQPVPGSDIGSFFLTDDGTLGGLEMIPVVVNFEMPVDSFSACILDIDFGELFIIQALDENAAIILSDTITAGDPDTGDGVPTCWGFNFGGCEGTVYSVRFEGHRELAGGFGLGMDNFSFCFSGVDIANAVVVETEDPICNETVGVITLVSSSESPLEYSMDGINFQSEPIFDDLPIGTYNIFVRDTSGCEAEFDNIQIEAYEPLVINEIDINSTTCGEENGTLNILTTPSGGASYSLNGVDFQEENSFVGLASNDYTLFILDAVGCPYVESFAIPGSAPPQITNIFTIDDFCNDSSGQLGFTIIPGTASSIMSTLNGTPMSPDDDALDALPAGNYELIVTDGDGCLVTEEATVNSGPEIIIDQIAAVGPSCDELDGQISVQASGGHGGFIYLLDSMQVQATGVFTQLLPDIYTLTAIDAFGCGTTTQVSISPPVCPIFIPNAFSPNFDGHNDDFIIYTHSNYDVSVLKCQVFDRWGELVWERSGFTLHTFRDWWDGMFRGKPALQGVYVYALEVVYNNGERDFLAGDVVLVR